MHIIPTSAGKSQCEPASGVRTQVDPRGVGKGGPPAERTGGQRGSWPKFFCKNLGTFSVCIDRKSNDILGDSFDFLSSRIALHEGSNVTLGSFLFVSFVFCGPHARRWRRQSDAPPSSHALAPRVGRGGASSRRPRPKSGPRGGVPARVGRTQAQAHASRLRSWSAGARSTSELRPRAGAPPGLRERRRANRAQRSAPPMWSSRAWRP
jgi:hypothetical protein